MKLLLLSCSGGLGWHESRCHWFYDMTVVSAQDSCQQRSTSLRLQLFMKENRLTGCNRPDSHRSKRTFRCCTQSPDYFEYNVHQQAKIDTLEHVSWALLKPLPDEAPQTGVSEGGGGGPTTGAIHCAAAFTDRRRSLAPAFLPFQRRLTGIQSTIFVSLTSPGPRP